MAISTAVIAMVMLSGQVGDEPLKSNPNIKFPTFGGTQVWTDQKIQSQWRIQKNVLTGHYRFLNDKNTRLAWGTLPQCQTAFAKAVSQGKIPPMKKDIVIVLHGLTRTRNSMSGTAKRISKANPNWSVITMSYASSRETIANHSKAVRNVIAQMKGVERVHFVGHSLGNLVVRRYLYDLQMRKPRPWPETGRIVMVAPPNQGSRIAEFFQDNPIFRTFWGVSGGQIAEWDTLAKTLAIPRSEFAIIAGGKKESKRNPLLEGQDDWVVTVEETRLPGARDFMVLPVIHSTMMGNRQVQDAAVRFLNTGALRENGKREPIKARP